MNLERTKPETLAAGVMDYMPSQSAVAHEYAERLNAALARLGLTDRLTLPPAPNTAIDELPGVVDVPLRKTLSVLMGKAQQGDASALATLEMAAQVMESIFAGLHARASVYPLALPSHESLATLSQGVDALLPRKISNGAWSLLADGTPSDGIDDGVSLVRLLCSAAADSVTELKDDNEGWVMTKALPTQLAAIVEDIQLGCSIMRMTEMNTKFIQNATYVKTLELPYLRSFQFVTGTIYDREVLINGAMIESVSTPELEEIIPTTGSIVTNNCQIGLFVNCPNLKEWYAPKLSRIWGSYLTDAPLEKVVLGRLKTDFMTAYNVHNVFLNNTNLIHFEIGAGTAVSLHMNWWNPTSVLSDSERLPIFLSNFKTYIAERLSEKGSGLTLTLSQAVRDAIEGDPTIAQIITSKGWTISPAPSV